MPEQIEMNIFDDDWNAPLGQVQDESKRQKYRFEIWIKGFGACLVLIGAFIAGFGGAASPLLRGKFGLIPQPLPVPANAALLIQPAAPSSQPTSQEATAALEQSLASTGSDSLTQTASQGTEADRIERSSGVKIVRPSGASAPGALIIDVAKALDKKGLLRCRMRWAGSENERPVARYAEIYTHPVTSLHRTGHALPNLCDSLRGEIGSSRRLLTRVASALLASAVHLAQFTGTFEAQNYSCAFERDRAKNCREF
ncbi:MAG: hypothetical protein FWC84_00050 [Alphaproteobacteria bacterium]|nr:hypothetical protein [Alphaproteobacteria bacterium]